MDLEALEFWADNLMNKVCLINIMKREILRFVYK